MPHRIHVLPPEYVASHPVRVTMQRYDDPLRHEVLLNARRTRSLAALTRRRDPVTVLRGYEVRRDDVVIAVALELSSVLPGYRRAPWFIVTTSGRQIPFPGGLFFSACEAYGATLRAEREAAENCVRRSRRHVLPVSAADRLDAEALNGLVTSL